MCACIFVTTNGMQGAFPPVRLKRMHLNERKQETHLFKQQKILAYIAPLEGSREQYLFI